MITLHPSTKRNRVYTRVPVEERFWQYVNKTDGCWLWTGATRQFGYGVINMGGKYGFTEGTHRLSWIIHNGPIPDGLCVCHQCDNPLCVNPMHLFLGTREDNNHDMQQKGRYDRVKRAKGERHWGAKLTEAQVLAARAEYDRGGVTQTALARQYDVSIASMHRILTRQNWRHI